VSSLCYVDQIL